MDWWIDSYPFPFGRYSKRSLFIDRESIAGNKNSFFNQRIDRWNFLIAQKDEEPSFANWAFFFFPSDIIINEGMMLLQIESRDSLRQLH